MTEIVIHQRTGGLARALAWVGWIGFAVSTASLIGFYGLYRDYFDRTGGIEERYHSGREQAADKIAVITVDGVILSGEGYVKQQIDRIRDDERVRAVVLRVNSPGGTVTASDYLYHHLVRLREEKDIPLVVSMGGIAASGGYYLAMAVGDQPRSIFAEPSTTTGSIGVIVPHYDISGLLEQWHVRDDSIASHPRKQMLSMTRPIAEDDREILQQYVAEAFGRFKEVVEQGRPKFREDSELLDELATGQIYTARQAHQHGLVDEIGFVEQAIARAAELAGLSADEVRVVEFQRPLTLAGLVGIAESRSRELDLESLLEWTAPQAYYLATRLPPLASSRP